MYFKLNTPQKDKYTDMGMINISAQFYLEEGDEGWEKYQAEHHVIVPIFPEEGYPRQKELQTEQEAQMISGDKETQGDERIAYDKWVAGLPTEERDNPFCNHAIQFEHDATEEEILWCFEWAMALTHHNYLQDDLHCEKGTTAKVVNQDIGYLDRRLRYFLTSWMIAEEKQKNPEISTDEAIMSVVHKTWEEKNRQIMSEYFSTQLQKIEKSTIKVEELKEIDFTAVETIASYNIRR